MKTRKYHIFGTLDGKTTHLREGSVRFSRTLRQAKEIARYTQATVFICFGVETTLNGKPTFKPDQQAERFPASIEHTKPLAKPEAEWGKERRERKTAKRTHSSNGLGLTREELAEDYKDFDPARA